MIEHTEGPWTIAQDNNVARWWLRGGGFFLGSIGNGTGSDESLRRAEANARLIQIAPDLLESLKEVTEMLRCSVHAAGGFSQMPGVERRITNAMRLIAQVDGSIENARRHTQETTA